MRQLLLPLLVLSSIPSLTLAEETPAPTPLAVLGQNQAPQASWTTGKKRLLYVPVDFSDFAGSPIEASVAKAEMEKVRQFYLDNSYGALEINTEVAPLLRMPFSFEELASFRGDLVPFMGRQVRELLEQNGTETRDYDFLIIAFNKRPVNGKEFPIFNGMSVIRGRTALISRFQSDEYDSRTEAHEIGHLLGLSHFFAGSWRTTDGSVIGEGVRKESGNPFDRMGRGYTWEGHFNSRSKYFLHWLKDEQIAKVTGSGTYEIAAQDDPKATGVVALDIPCDAKKSYWLEIRQNFPDFPIAGSGALLHQIYPDGSVDLLNTNPTAKLNEEGGALLVGTTFADNANGIYITPLQREGNRMKVRVNRGTFEDNKPPKSQFTTYSKKARPGVSVGFEVAATDPDDDELAYFWDFGDGTFSKDNKAKVSKSFRAPGFYHVRCAVTDMKGGVVTGTGTIEVR